MSTEEPIATKESLAWFQQRRDRWKKAPRPKVIPLSPKTPCTTTPSNTIPITEATPRSIFLKTEQGAVPSSTNVVATTTTASAPTFSFGAAAPASSIQPSKPLFGASLGTSFNPFTIGSSQSAASTSKPGSMLGNVQLTPSINSSDATSTSKHTGFPRTTATFAVKGIDVPPGASTSSAFSPKSAVFAGTNLAPSSSIIATNTAPKPSSTIAGFGSQSKTPTNETPGSVFANINLVPSLGMGSTVSQKSTFDFPSAKPKDEQESSSESKPFSFPFGTTNSSSSVQPPLTKPTGMVRNAAAGKSNKKTTAAPPHSAPTSTAPSAKFLAAPKPETNMGSIFANIQLTPDASATSSSDTMSSSSAKPLDAAPDVTTAGGVISDTKPKSSTLSGAPTAFGSTTATTVTAANSVFGSNKPLFGASAGTSPFTFGASSVASSISNPVPVFAGISVKSKDDDEPSPSLDSVKAKVSTGMKSTSSDKRKMEQESSSDVASGNDDHRSRLEAFYEKHNPEKLDTVDATLEKYKGNEGELFRKLEAKYTPTIPTSKYPLPSGEGPTCFLEFTIGGELAGKVTVKLFHDKVPLACDNFRALCTGLKGKGRKGKPLCYKNSKVHRVVPMFCVQMGDFTLGDGTGGESIYEPNTSGVSDSMGRFKDEAFLQHSKKGLLSMANNGANRNGSQFFFTLRPCTSLDGKHVVFGEVTSGMDVVEKIGQLKTTPKQRPEPSVEISNCGEIVDGKEILCQVTTEQAPAPFSFGASLGNTSDQPNSLGFGGLAVTAKTRNSFGFGATSSSTGSSPFSFGAVASSLQSNSGGFGTSPAGVGESSNGASAAVPPSTSFGFGATSSSTGSSPFSFGAVSSSLQSRSGGFGASPAGVGKPSSGASVAVPSSNPSPFTFGAATSTTTTLFGSGSLPTFGSTSSNPFSFGSLSAAAGATSGGESPFSFGARPDSGSTRTTPSESSSPGFSFRGRADAAEVSESEDDDSSYVDDDDDDDDDDEEEEEEDDYSDDE